MTFIGSNARFSAINGTRAANRSDLDPVVFGALSQRPTSTAKGETFGDLIGTYRLSPEWGRRTEATQQTYNSSLKKLECRYSHVPLAVFDRPEARPALLAWRASLSNTPAATDSLFAVLSTLLGFAVSMNKLNINVARNFSDLYRLGRRAVIVWEPHEIELMVAEAEEQGRPEVADLILLAWLTGFRLGDLVTVGWQHINGLHITKQLEKRSRGKVAVANVPLDDRLDDLLVTLDSRCRQPGVTTLIVDREGAPIRKLNFDYPFRMVRNAVGIGFIDALTEETYAKTIHDLRGTKATELLAFASYSDEQVANFMGWSEGYVRIIRPVYVDERTRVASIAHRAAQDAALSKVSISF